MENFPILKNTPIKEVIIGISYDGAVDLELFDKLKDIEEIYRNFDERILTEHTDISIRKDEKQEITTKKSGLILRNLDEGKMLQFKIGSVSLHLIDRYLPLSQLIDELEKYWNVFIQQNTGATIINISVRYLNFIPFEANDSIKDYLKIHSNSPFEDLKVDDFCRIKFKLDETYVNLVSTKGKIANEEGAILDYSLRKEIKSETNVFEELKNMRKTKNKIFFTSITDKTLNLYRS